MRVEGRFINLMQSGAFWLIEDAALAKRCQFDSANHVVNIIPMF